MIRAVIEGIGYRAAEMISLIKKQSSYTLDTIKIDGRLAKYP
jgi:glycerol kinase